MSSTNALPIAYLMPGQGSQYSRMGVGVYGREAAFTGAMDQVFHLLGPDGHAIRSDWLSRNPKVPVNHVSRSQILLFAVDYALGVQFTEWGLPPAALLGHSVGELAASVLAGVFSLTDAVRLLWDRIGRLAEAPPGGMLAVAASEAEVRRFCDDQVVIGAVNADRQVILAGPRDRLSAVSMAIAEAGVTARWVPASTGFHSPMLGFAAAGSLPLIARTPVRAPRIPLYSGYTGVRMDAATALDPGYWAAQPVAPVLFWQGLQSLLADGPWFLLEVGPGAGLSALARRHPAVRSGTSPVFQTLPPRPGTEDLDLAALHSAAARLLPRALL